jgi:HlyD family secretion protein
MSSRPYQGAGGRVLRAALLGAALLSLAAAGCGKKSAGFTSSGTFEAVEVDAGSQVVGQLMVLSKREGDAVAKGELLARVDTRKLEIQRDLLQVQLEQVALDEDLIRKSIEAAKISLENDLKSLERTRTLFNQRSATQQQLDDIATAVELDRNRLATAQKNRQGPPIRRRELEANLRLVEQNIQDSQVNSPIDGQVTVRYVEPGEIGRAHV